VTEVVNDPFICLLISSHTYISGRIYMLLK
jgi:hypothetical protein